MFKVSVFASSLLFSVAYGLTASEKNWIIGQQQTLKSLNFTPYEIKVITKMLEEGLENPSKFSEKLTKNKLNTKYAYQFSKAPLADYIKYHVTTKRVETGLAMMHHYHKTLTKIEKKYQVQSQYFVAIWGIETFYGQDLPGKYILQMLAPLAYSGRRSEYFSNELTTAYKIMQNNQLTSRILKGSVSADMGQPQFQPSSFVSYAIDFNEDGRKDIWHTEADVLASIANYLHQRGWKNGEPWGTQVKIPENFSAKHGYRYEKTIQHWRNLGVKLLNGDTIPNYSFKASLLLYDGVKGPAFLLYPNFKVLMRWNPTYYEAISIGVLADKLAADKSVNVPASPK